MAIGLNLRLTDFQLHKNLFLINLWILDRLFFYRHYLYPTAIILWEVRKKKVKSKNTCHLPESRFAVGTKVWLPLQDVTGNLLGPLLSFSNTFCYNL